MDTTEHTASGAASEQNGGRGLLGAILVAAVLLAIGWLALSGQTAPGSPRADASAPRQAATNARGIIRTSPVAQASADSGAPAVTFAGLKLDHSLGSSGAGALNPRGPAEGAAE